MNGIIRGLAAVVLLWGGLALEAQTTVVTDLTFLTTLERQETGEPGMGTLTLGRLSFDAQGSREIRAQLVLDLQASDTMILSLHKAFVKARLGDLRLTVGKTRQTWGEGVMFNAGDVIFSGGEVDLTADDLRDATRWLGGLTWSWDSFSILEALVLPPDFPLFDQILWSSGSPLQPQFPRLEAWYKTSGGGRLVTRWGDWKTEAGYLYDGREEEHRPYLSLQGALGEVNLQGSVGWTLPSESPLGRDGQESLEVSSGVFWQWPLGAGYDEDAGVELPSSSQLGFRLEGLWKPWRAWSEVVSPLGEKTQMGDYALALYPEISWKSDVWTFYLRSLVVPAEGAAKSTLAVQWAPLQGFRLLASVSLQTGDRRDLWGWDRAQGWQATVGARSIF